MKSFFKYVLATLVGIMLSFMLFLIIMTVIVVQSAKSTSTQVDANSVLYISLGHGITEKEQKTPLDDLNLPGFVKSLGLDAILDRIEAAKEDDKIKGIYLNPSAVGAGTATINAIRNALEDFKSSGKFVYAFSDFYTQQAYYVASSADSVFMNPQGTLDFRGISSSVMFMKDALDKLGVDVQVVKVGSYKSAVEPFIQGGMSPENREQVTSYVNSLYDNMLAPISASRKISTDSLKNIAATFASRTPEGALSSGLVDELIYKEQFIAKIKNALKIDQDKDVSTVSILDYKPTSKGNKGSGRIGVLYAFGDIIDGEGMQDNIGGDRISRELRKLRENDRIDAVVLRVNSPGGSALASEVIWREVELTKKEKPVIVSMGDYAASGGYYISAAADSIFADPSTLTGSIGVFAMIPNVQNLLNNKLGVRFESVSTSPMAEFGTAPDRPLNQEELDLMQSLVDNVYDTFLTRVADGRKMSKEAVHEIAQGRVWTGEQAIGIGLVDRLGGLEDAIASAATMAELESYKVTKYPLSEDPWSTLFQSSKEKIKSKWIKEEMGEFSEYILELKTILSRTGVQARIPYEVNIK